MLLRLLCIAALALVAACSSRRVTNHPAAAQEIIRLENMRLQGYMALDTALIGPLLARDYRVVVPSGERTANREEAIQAIIEHPPHWTMLKAEISDPLVRVFPGTVVTTGLWILRRMHGQPESVRPLTVCERFMHVWAREEDDWKLSLRQITPVDCAEIEQ